MKGLLVRVGIDQTTVSGGWNAPVDAKTWRFVYVPIRDATYNDSGYIDGGERVYQSEVSPALAEFGRECGDPKGTAFQLPTHLSQQPMHLDPDFLTLTYGDSQTRGRKLIELDSGDFIAFYASLMPLPGQRSPWNGKLVYALIGFYELKGKPLDASVIPDADRSLNAHTRWARIHEGDIVAHGLEGASGLFDQCIPIGEWRNRAYRVRVDLLSEWGGLDITDGFIQLSPRLFEFDYPRRFRDWLEREFMNRKIRVHREQYQVPKRKATSEASR
jgi:hypothetical protein